MDVYSMMRLFRRDESPAETDARLVIGLGNPGLQYEQTRHNAGFLVLDALAERHGLRFGKSKNRALVCRGTIAGVRAVLAKPETYMNDSGHAAGHLVRYYNVDPERVIVVCDDLDLPFGILRVRPGGNHGGQRGLESIIHVLGTMDFPRVRVGIGRPPGDAASYVLSRFSSEQRAHLDAIIEKAADAVEALLTSDAQAVMNGFNRSWLS